MLLFFAPAAERLVFFIHDFHEPGPLHHEGERPFHPLVFDMFLLGEGTCRMRRVGALHMQLSCCSCSWSSSFFPNKIILCSNYRMGLVDEMEGGMEGREGTGWD